jgi:hypothetical protein
MKSKLTLVQPVGMDLRNVVTMGPADFVLKINLNSLNYKRVKVWEMTESDKERLVCFESCKHRNERLQQCTTNCSRRCIWGVIRMTPEEIKNKKIDLTRLYPRTRW